MRQEGFTLIETLIVLAIIGVLTSVIIPAVNYAREKAYYSRTLSEYKSMETALEMYVADHNGQYPDDVNRDLPAGLGPYLESGQGLAWPKAPWPGSVYDWDNWQDPDDPTERIYQVSIRFCPAGGDITTCKFPKETWAQNFGVNSSVYYCISGNCRSHINEPEDYPGYCVNCSSNGN